MIRTAAVLALTVAALALGQVAQASPRTTIYGFGYTDNPLGETPTGGVVKDHKGNGYGTTYQGGAGGCGTIWALSPASATPPSTMTLLHTFCPSA